MKSKRQQKAFTLVELLVVIAIISVLAGLLLPVLEDAIGSARMVECMGNMKQMMQGVQMYADDNRGWTPTNAQFDGDIDLYSRLTVGGYLPCDDAGTVSRESCGTMFCPIRVVLGVTPPRAVPFAIRRYPSAQTCYDIGSGKLRSIRQLYYEFPYAPVDIDYAYSEFIMYGDACLDSGAQPTTVIYSSGGPYVFNMRHNELGTGAFADGHSACISQEDLYAVYGIQNCYIGLGTMKFD